jgi:photosystem II stability/assembly factor-like uncharacterized protein
MAVGYHGFVETTSDGGETWTQRVVPGSVRLFGIDMIDEDSAWAGAAGGSVWRTDDLGVSWTQHPTGLAGAPSINDVVDLGHGTVLAVASGGLIARSNDDGTTWASVPSGVATHLFDLEVADDTGRVWAVGAAGTVLTSSDRGRTWVVRSIATANDIQAIQSLGDDDALAVGYGDTIRRTTDGGSTWTSPPSPIAGTGWKDVDGAGAVLAMVGGTSGQRAVSTDGGATWTTDLGFFTNSSIVVTGANSILMGATSSRIDRRMPDVSIPDYASGTADWSSAGGAFGVCLQDAALGASPVWLEDDGGTAGLCEPSNTDRWNAVPTTPTTIAQTIVSGASGRVDLVWGMRTGSSTPAGDYRATVSVEVIAP